ncbi:hypothetical protein RRG08_058920 [Elysia crispata]|uniref:Uncharacterized protein n=1 Tax=Elysia crispata TaxID=231223 RepID=A0AAE1CKS3_9GAST|nr:hypothetical protein RRG08_058920 [Elysia crispata]
MRTLSFKLFKSIEKNDSCVLEYTCPHDRLVGRPGQVTARITGHSPAQPGTARPQQSSNAPNALTDNIMASIFIREILRSANDPQTAQLGRRRPSIL